MCGGTGKILPDGKPCPICSKEKLDNPPVVFGVPAQYQGIKFDKSFLPEKMQKYYGQYMEDLMEEIVTNISTFQKNILICSRPNSGKTVWSYNLYSQLTGMGINMPLLRDLAEVRNILNAYDADVQEAQLFSTARCAIVRVPRDIQAWMFDCMSFIVERRVRSSGFTIFLYGGEESDLKNQDRFGKLKYLKGSGAYNTIQIKSFSDTYNPEGR